MAKIKARIREIPDPVALGLDWPDVVLARNDVIRLRGRLAEAYADLGKLRTEKEAAEEADRVARQAAAKAGKPMPKPTADDVEKRRLVAQQYATALEGAMEEAENDVRDVIKARLRDLREDAAELAELRRKAYERAVLALGETRDAHREAAALAAYLADFPNASFKAAAGYLRNQPQSQTPPPMWDTVFAALRADAAPIAAKAPPPTYARPLLPREAEFAVSATPNMEPSAHRNVR